ncbi:MAG: competence/damage-inducible protein A [Alphaproteobacteria bacterium]|nr:competence/damage-inducible protein A [Alphaproteobacteria bacterium]MCB9928624.1 competence/damage-inducible protein A [Alphaproteobacteria bacterium]
MAAAHPDETVVTAAIAVIGNEILSGSVQDENIAYIARGLNEIGIQLREVRVVPDIHREIADAVNALRGRWDYVFTTGGIGPTHDDITAEAVALAFERKVTYHPEAFARLEAFYASRGQDFTEGRKRMTLAPEGAELVNNEAMIAPGLKVENVFVLAGVPRIAQAMFEATKPYLRRGNVVHSRSITTHLVEGELAGPLEAIQKRHPHADLGSYPFYNTPRGNGVKLVARATSQDLLDTVGDEIRRMIADLGGETIEDDRSW